MHNAKCHNVNTNLKNVFLTAGPCGTATQYCRNTQRVKSVHISINVRTCNYLYLNYQKIGLYSKKASSRFRTSHKTRTSKYKI